MLLHRPCYPLPCAAISLSAPLLFPAANDPCPPSAHCPVSPRVPAAWPGELVPSARDSTTPRHPVKSSEMLGAGRPGGLRESAPPTRTPPCALRAAPTATLPCRGWKRTSQDPVRRSEIGQSSPVSHLATRMAARFGEGGGSGQGGRPGRRLPALCCPPPRSSYSPRRLSSPQSHPGGSPTRLAPPPVPAAGAAASSLAARQALAGPRYPGKRSPPGPAGTEPK